MNSELRLSIPVDVMTRKLGEEVVILDLRSGTYFGLNPVGARLWELLAAGQSVGQACRTLLSEFDVRPQQLNEDVGHVVRALLDKQLLQVADTALPP